MQNIERTGELSVTKKLKLGALSRNAIRSGSEDCCSFLYTKNKELLTFYLFVKCYSSLSTVFNPKTLHTHVLCKLAYLAKTHTQRAWKRTCINLIQLDRSLV